MDYGLGLNYMSGRISYGKEIGGISIFIANYVFNAV